MKILNSPTTMLIDMHENSIMDRLYRVYYDITGSHCENLRDQIIRGKNRDIYDHEFFIFEVSQDLFEDCLARFSTLQSYTGIVPPPIGMTMDKDRYIISGTIGMIRNIIKSFGEIPMFVKYIIESLPKEERNLFDVLDGRPIYFPMKNSISFWDETGSNWVKRITKDDLHSAGEVLTHSYETVKFSVDRKSAEDITKNFYTYIQLNQGSDANEEFTVISPFKDWGKDEEEPKGYSIWKNTMENFEKKYSELIADYDVSKEVIESILPACTLSTVIVTANIYGWSKFFDDEESGAIKYSSKTEDLILSLRRDFMATYSNKAPFNKSNQ